MTTDERKITMIYSVRGKLILKEPNFAVIECGGVGYGCRTSYSTVAQLGETGSETMLYTYLYVREDAVELFGFVSQQELSCFKLLISVSGEPESRYLHSFGRDSRKICVPCGVWRQQGVHQDQGYRRKDGAEDSS